MSGMELCLEPHPLLDLSAFVSVLPEPLGELPSPEWLLALHDLGADAPLKADDDTRGQVRELLRHGGYKPTGRGKPASEYLLKAAAEGRLGSINAAVDACNAVSLHSGLPISLVDLDRARPPLRVGIAPAASSYVFNQTGQEIRLDGLLCLSDAEGPCANAVKDSQRTKTQGDTRRTLAVIWGVRAQPERTRAALAWYRELVERLGGSVADVAVSGA